MDPAEKIRALERRVAQLEALVPPKTEHVRVADVRVGDTLWLVDGPHTIVKIELYDNSYIFFERGRSFLRLKGDRMTSRVRGPFPFH